ncbi:MAG: hypothetical protein AAFW01_18440, partial [Pseudomonadota bacterium]
LEEKVRRGEISADVAARHPQRNALTSAVMGDDLELYDQNEIEISVGDTVILASDGIETLSMREVEAAFDGVGDPDPDALCKALIDAVAAKRVRKQDNTTVIAIATSDSAPGWEATLRRVRRGLFGPMAGIAAASVLAAAALAAAGAFLLSAPSGSESDAVARPDAAGSATSLALRQVPAPAECVLESVERESSQGLIAACKCIVDGESVTIGEGLRDDSIIADFRWCAENGGQLPDSGLNPEASQENGATPQGAGPETADQPPARPSDYPDPKPESARSGETQTEPQGGAEGTLGTSVPAPNADDPAPTESAAGSEVVESDEKDAGERSESSEVAE